MAPPFSASADFAIDEDSSAGPDRQSYSLCHSSAVPTSAKECRIYSHRVRRQGPPRSVQQLCGRTRRLWSSQDLGPGGSVQRAIVYDAGGGAGAAGPARAPAAHRVRPRAVGSGAALDAATRGLKVALVEARDLASGTSSRSSKLFHGGLRYLEQLEFGLVRKPLHGRELMLPRRAPHLANRVVFLS